MANQAHISILKQGLDVWNTWRVDNPELRPDLSKADLHQARLSEINFSNADMFGADLTRAELCNANLHKAYLREANLVETDLTRANLRGAHLREARLNRAILVDADLSFATLVMADLQGADLTGSSIYGISAWEVILNDETQQTGLVISKAGNPAITVDNLEVAQFIYLLLNNRKIRDVIDTITSKVVLILGRFTPERKSVLDSIREELSKRDYLPILFDFDKPTHRDTLETISTLAHMARFVIADLTDAKSELQELESIVPSLPSVPVQPILLSTDYEPGMIDHFRNYRSFLEPYRYDTTDDLIASLEDRVIHPAEQRSKEFLRR